MRSGKQRRRMAAKARRRHYVSMRDELRKLQPGTFEHLCAAAVRRATAMGVADVNHIYFDEPVELTPELAELIGCGLPQVIAEGPASVGPPLTCIGIDPVRRLLTFATKHPRPRRTLCAAGGKAEANVEVGATRDR